MQNIIHIDLCATSDIAQTLLKLLSRFLLLDIYGKNINFTNVAQ